MTFFPLIRPHAIGVLRNPVVLAFLLFAASCPAVISAAIAEPKQAPSSRVSLDLGPSFQPSDRFSGFVDESSGASFVIIEMPPQAYEEVKLIPERTDALAKQGLSDAATAELPGRSGEYVYFTAKQKAGGVDVAKYVLIFRESDLTVMVSTNIPQAALDAGTYTKPQIEAILASAMVEATAAKAVELFRLGYLGPFKETLGLMGTTRAYSTSGRKPTRGENMMIKEPILLVSLSIDNLTVDTKLSAQRSFKTLGGLTKKTVESENEVTIAGLKGYQIKGETADEKTGTKIAINLVHLAGEPRGYYVIVGTVPAEGKDKFMPEIEKVIASFEPVKAEK
jgi:hypothetical protein